MTEFQSGFIALMKGSLLETVPTVPDGFDYMEAYRLAEEHQVVPLLYYSAATLPSFLQSTAMGAFFQRSCSYISHSAHQEDVLNKLFSLFDKEGISYMPLKGTVLKSLYPSPEMRVMGDADILIRLDEYDRIRQVMTAISGVEFSESDHEYIWMISSKLSIELHKHLIPSYNKDYYAYYGDGWQLARPMTEGSTRYVMSDEDMLIYLFTHFAKHYRDKGAGIKYVVDFFVYRRAHPHMDMQYLEREMTKLHLWDFYRHIMHLVDVWFCDAEPDEMSDYLTEKIFFDGVFGRNENSAASEGLKLSKTTKSVKRKKAMQMAFPPYASMCLKYPVLKKWAILLPFLWVWRWLTVLFGDRRKLKKVRSTLDQMSDERISDYQRELNYVGLDYYFDEEDDPPKDNKNGKTP